MTGRRSELAKVTTTRQLRCGHWVRIIVARKYQPHEEYRQDPLPGMAA